MGYGIGNSIFLAQTLVALIFLPAIWWTAYSRFRGMLPYLFGLIVLVLITALVTDGAQRSISVSMHYNRWAWAAAFVAITLAVVPTRDRGPLLVDGLIIGAAMTFMALTKITFFISFAPPVILALIVRGNFHTLLISFATGLILAGMATVLLGGDFWIVYVQDLLTVINSDVRVFPGESLAAVIAAPAGLGGSLVLIASIIMLRQSGEAAGGLLLLALMPAFYYVTYQNFGNDPQWLPLLGIMLLAFLPRQGVRNGFGWDLRVSLKIAAAMAFALSAPTYFNMATSPFRHLRVDETRYTQLIIRSEQHTDLFVTINRAYRPDTAQLMMTDGTGLEANAALAEGTETILFRGETLPMCELVLGYSGWFSVIVRDLEDAGLSGDKTIFAADLVSSHWLFGDFQPMKNGAPWYYGGLPGIDDVDYLIVPLCPLIPAVRALVLEAVDEAKIPLTEIRRTPLYILYSVNLT